MSESTISKTVEWFVQLDGDFAQGYPTKADALDGRRNAFGHIAPNNRRVWKKVTKIIETDVDWRDYE